MFRNKALALTLALVFVLSISAVAFADTSDVTFTVGELSITVQDTIDVGLIAPETTKASTSFTMGVVADSATITVSAAEGGAAWPDPGYSLVFGKGVGATTWTGVDQSDEVAIAFNGVHEAFDDLDPIAGSAGNVATGVASGDYNTNTVTVGVGPDGQNAAPVSLTILLNWAISE